MTQVENEEVEMGSRKMLKKKKKNMEVILLTSDKILHRVKTSKGPRLLVSKIIHQEIIPFMNL